MLQITPAFLYVHKAFNLTLDTEYLGQGCLCILYCNQNVTENHDELGCFFFSKELTASMISHPIRLAQGVSEIWDTKRPLITQD